MVASIGDTLELDNMLPDPGSGAGMIVLVGLIDPDEDDGENCRAARLALSWDHEGEEVERITVVKIGETFQVGDQTWRLDSVNLKRSSNRPRSYHATITRVA